MRISRSIGVDKNGEAWIIPVLGESEVSHADIENGYYFKRNKEEFLRAESLLKQKQKGQEFNK